MFILKHVFSDRGNLHRHQESVQTPLCHHVCPLESVIKKETLNQEIIDFGFYSISEKTTCSAKWCFAKIRVLIHSPHFQTNNLTFLTSLTGNTKSLVCVLPTFFTDHIVPSSTCQTHSRFFFHARCREEVVMSHSHQLETWTAVF